MKITAVLSTLFALTAVSFALPEVNPQKAWRPAKAASVQKSVSVKPAWQGNAAIQCGNKKVTLSANGNVQISNSAGELMTIALQYVFQNKEDKSIDWITTTPALCKMRKE